MHAKPETYGIVGAGVIGSAMARRLAQHSCSVVIMDTSVEALRASEAAFDTLLARLVEKGKLITEAAAEIKARVTYAHGGFSALSKCTFVLEATTESLEVKHAVLARLEDFLGDGDWVIASTTSGLPRAQMATCMKHPERLGVYHPFSPADRSWPVEIVASPNKAVTERIRQFALMLDACPLEVQDVACFAADRFFTMMMLEACVLVQDGVVTPGQVDKVVDAAIGGGGPFRVMDFIHGNQIIAHCAELMYAAHDGNLWYTAPAALTSRGMDPWNPERPEEEVPEDLARTIMDRMLGAMFIEAFDIVAQGIMDAGNFNWLTQLAFALKKGILELAEDLGLDEVTRICQTYIDTHSSLTLPKCLQGDAPALPEFYRDVVVEEIEGGFAVVTVRRPERMNALDSLTIRELSAVFEELEGDMSIVGIVFTGFGGILAGADIRELAALTTPAELSAHAGEGQQLTLAMEEIGRKKPIVFVVNGPVLGGGCEMAMACCARVCGPKAVIGQPEVNLGIIPGFGGTVRLPRLVGLEKGAAMLRTGKSMKAAEAVKASWALELADDPMAAAFDLLDRHCKGQVKLQPLSPTDTLKAVSSTTDVPPAGTSDVEFDIGHHSRAIDMILCDVIMRGGVLPMAQALAVELEGFGACGHTKDMKIGLATFVEKGARAQAPFVHE